jgi:hypothetical protein
MVEICGRMQMELGLAVHFCRDNFCEGFVVYKSELVNVS